MLKAVLFDLDGTLVDTERLYLQANAQAAAELGHALPAAAFRRLVGAPSLTADPWLVATFGAALPAFIQLSEQAVAAKLAAGQVPAIAGADALLHRLTNAGLRLGIVTSSPAAYLSRVVALQHWAPLLAWQVALESGRPKPAPDSYLAALRAAKLPAAQVVAVEDTPIGVAAATAAGLRCLQLVDLAPAAAAATAHFSRLAAVGDWLLA